ncbi:hypothetical protein QT972_22735 [Microcoleus sp. herbarium7]|uniref:hypothetical protein n=1 Tax=Microcoleus sp. herbarium7 TaxID=3055435 RepID=UPI002FD78787
MADPTAKPPIPTKPPATQPIAPTSEPAKKPNPGVALSANKPAKADRFASMTPEQLKAVQTTDKAVDLGKLGTATPKLPGTLVGAANDPPPGPRYKTYIEVKIADKTYTNLDGDFLGSPKIVSATRQYSHARIMLNDLDEKIFKETGDQSECEVIIGFADGEKRTKLKGKIWSIGRIPPDCTVIMIVDPSAKLAGSATATNSAAEKPSELERPESVKTEAGKFWDSVVKPKELDPFSKIAAELVADPKKATGTAKPGEKPDLSPVKPPEKTAEPAKKEQFQASFKGQSPTFDKLMDKVKTASTQAKGDSLNYSTAERFSFTGASSDSRLKFQNSTDFNTSKGGEILVGASPGHAAALEAIMQGDVIVVAQGDTLKQVGPGQGEPSGVILDYNGNRAVFIGKPEITKRSPLQLSSGQGAITVVAPNIEQKTINGATVATPGKPAQHPTGIVKIPSKGDIKLADPLSPGCPYTWGDMTRQGEFVTDLKPEHIEGAVKMSQYLTQWTAETGGKKWMITSWFRPSWYNLKVARSGANGPHTHGSAVDFWFEGFIKLYDKLDPSWPHGLAIAPAGSPCGEFCHVDLTPSPMRRWAYSHLSYTVTGLF